MLAVSLLLWLRGVLLGTQDPAQFLNQLVLEGLLEKPFIFLDLLIHAATLPRILWSCAPASSVYLMGLFPGVPGDIFPWIPLIALRTCLIPANKPTLRI